MCLSVFKCIENKPFGPDILVQVWGEGWVSPRALYQWQSLLPALAQHSAE